jgi:HD-GYP domain-containing protein (c-di-GMP phosphodiesterase class II)
MRELAIVGILHDIGKLSVPYAILAKPGRLTDEEMDVIRLHRIWRDELLAQLGHPERIRRWVRGHHERLDASGYPDGLGGSRLDLEAPNARIDGGGPHWIARWRSGTLLGLLRRQRPMKGRW